jgi:hypothetical protein
MKNLVSLEVANEVLHIVNAFLEVPLGVKQQ